MKIDMHVHTSYGSSDSNLSLDELVNRSKIIDIDAVCLTEHGGPWGQQAITHAQQRFDRLQLLDAIEIETEVGHITGFGFTKYISGMRNPEDLRKIADKENAFIVLAHPFRNFTQKPPYNNNNLLFKDYKIKPQTIEDVSKHPIFQLVDAIEVLNGGTSERENLWAWDVAKYLGKPMVGGSDAHSFNGVGRYMTVFEDEIDSVKSLLYSLKNGKYYPAELTESNAVVPFRR
jgi:predicted metal-dependent phosphoesterase TrpH